MSRMEGSRIRRETPGPRPSDKLKSRDDPERPLLGSMGIYLFNVDVLERILTYHPRHDDFGINIIPEAVHSQNVYGFKYNGYWRDMGTIRAYYETNLELTTQDAPFSFYDPKLPIYTLEDYLPGSIVQDSTLTEVLLAEGCWIEKAEITRSVVGIRSQIGAGTCLKDTVLNGSDFYAPDIGIGPGWHRRGHHQQERPHRRGRRDPAVSTWNRPGSWQLACTGWDRGAPKGRGNRRRHPHRARELEPPRRRPSQELRLSAT